MLVGCHRRSFSALLASRLLIARLPCWTTYAAESTLRHSTSRSFGTRSQLPPAKCHQVGSFFNLKNAASVQRKLSHFHIFEMSLLPLNRLRYIYVIHIQGTLLTSLTRELQLFALGRQNRASQTKVILSGEGSIELVNTITLACSKQSKKAPSEMKKISATRRRTRLTIQKLKVKVNTT